MMSISTNFESSAVGDVGHGGCCWDRQVVRGRWRKYSWSQKFFLSSEPLWCADIRQRSRNCSESLERRGALYLHSSLVSAPLFPLLKLDPSFSSHSIHTKLHIWHISHYFSALQVFFSWKTQRVSYGVLTILTFLGVLGTNQNFILTVRVPFL